METYFIHTERQEDHWESSAEETIPDQAFCDEIAILVNRKRAVSVVEFDLSESFGSFDPVFHLVKREGAGEGAPGTGAETSLQPVERTTVEKTPTCSSRTQHWRRWKFPGGGGNFLEELQPMESPYWSKRKV